MSKCGLIKNQFFLDPDGTTTYCCESVPDGVNERKTFKLTDWDVKREYELNLYEESKQGWLDECLLCKYSEDTFGSSMRTRSANTEEHDYISKAIIKTSNHCNLGCRMCGPELSTYWQHLVRHNPNEEFASEYVLEETSDSEFEILKQHVFTPHLTSLIFSGGESLLSKKNYQIIEYLIGSGLAKNINLHITTNGTVKIKDAWLEAAKEFKELVLEFSIDGSSYVYDYIRPGGKWTTLIDVVDYTQNLPYKVFTKFNYVAQTLNAHSIHNDIKSIENIFNEIDADNIEDCISVCYVAPEDSYASLHPILRNKYNVDKYSGNIEYNPDAFAKFMRKHKWLDKVHNTSLKQHNPDFFDTDIYPEELINEYYSNR